MFSSVVILFTFSIFGNTVCEDPLLGNLRTYIVCPENEVSWSWNSDSEKCEEDDGCGFKDKSVCNDISAFFCRDLVNYSEPPQQGCHLVDSFAWSPSEEKCVLKKIPSCMIFLPSTVGISEDTCLKISNLICL